MNLYKIHAVNTDKNGSQSEIPEFVVAKSSKEAEDKYIKEWKAWDVNIVETITYAIDIIL